MATKAKEEVQGAAVGGSAAQGTANTIANQIAQAMSDMESMTKQVTTSINDNMQKMQSISEDIAKKQDTNVDENLAGQQAVNFGSNAALANLVNNSSASHANIALSRGQTYFDQLTTIASIHIANTSAITTLGHALLTLDGHQQCAANSANRGMVHGK